MSAVQDFEKKRFIIEECMMFSFNAGMQTRNKNWPVYSKDIDFYSGKRDIRYMYDNSSNLKLDVFDFLGQYLHEIKHQGIGEEIHLQKIQLLANTLTTKFKPVLHEGRFRIGISQKIINLFLKYMWSMGVIPEPCHCPIDGIVKSQISKRQTNVDLVDWTKLDSIDEYLDYIRIIKEIATQEGLSIAQWEFLNWNRR